MRADIKERLAMIERGEVPEGYKKDKKHIIPNAWSRNKLGIFEDKIGSGKTPYGGERTYINEGIPFIRSQNVLNNKLDINNVVYISKETHDEMKATKIMPNDILLNITGASIGRCCLVPNTFKNGNLNQHVCIIRTKEVIDREFLVQVLISDIGQNQIHFNQAGGNREGLNFEQIRNIEIPVPPISEQKKISDILVTWDRAIELKEKLLEQKKLQKKGLIQQILHQCFAKCKCKEIKEIAKQRIEINSNNKSFPVLSCTKYNGLVSSLEYFQRQVYSENLEKYKVVRKKWFAYATNHIEEGSIGLQLQYDAGVVSPMYTVFELNTGMDEEFVFAILKTETYRRRYENMMNASVNRRGSLRWNDFSKIKIPVPEYEMQKKMAEIIRFAENEISLLEEELKLLKAQKKGLMQLLLTGKVRVPC